MVRTKTALVEKYCLNCGFLFVARVRSNGRFCSHKCASSGRFNSNAGNAGALNPNWRGGMPDCIGCGIKLSAKHVTHCKSCARKEELNVNWLGGITPLNQLVRHSAQYRNWRKAVFERDNYTCTKCGERGGDKHADHIKPFALYPKLRFELTNGRTLCVPCHRATDTYGSAFLKQVAGGLA